MDQTPSWVNANGRIDRCACVEVRAQEVWRDAPIVRAARTTSGRISTKLVLLTADWLRWLHDSRLPRQLAGDFRTAQANAMRPVMAATKRTRRSRLVRDEPPPFRDYGLPHNPNRGAAREKLIGIPETWSHPLRLELWKFGRGLNKHFLICPHSRNCPNHSAQRRRAGAGADDDSAREFETGIDEGDPRLPRLSTIKRGSKMNLKVCPQRVSKLFLVMCTPREMSDARVAQAWMESLPRNLLPKHQESVARLLNRYGVLLHPRRLLCQRCLGVRYNQGSERRRRQYTKIRGRRYGERTRANGGPGFGPWKIRYGVSGAYVVG